jgi:hypothetical protein
VGTICHLDGRMAINQSQLALFFDDQGLWLDAVNPPNTGSLQSGLKEERLSELATSMKLSRDFDFYPRDKKFVELQLAFSLFYLHSNQLLRGPWDLDKIDIQGSASSSHSYDHWRPLLSCHLNQVQDEHDGDDDKIVSFGLLMAEIGAGDRLTAIPADNDWETGLPSKRLMLRRALDKWERVLEDAYKSIGNACLQLAEFSEGLYNAELSMNQKRTAAIYRHILAPLYVHVRNNFQDVSRLFQGFPRQERQALRQANANGQGVPVKVKLFDGSKRTYHDPT